MSEKMAKNDPKRRIGRPPRTGAYSVMIRRGELPERRRYLRPFIEDVRAGLIADLGPRDEDLTTAQRLMIDRAISLLMVIRCIEEEASESGVFRGGAIDSVLKEVYITYVNSFRLALQAIGIDKKKIEEPLSVREYIVRATAEEGAKDR